MIKIINRYNDYNDLYYMEELRMRENVYVPLYQQVKEDIKTAIESGKYKTKERIPSEQELSAEYSVSRITIRRAVEELCGEGYLTKMQGRGTFVSSPRFHRKFSASNRLESFTQSCQNKGMEAGAKLLDRKIVPARQDEADFFGLAADDLLLYIQRLRTADNLPVFLENIFLPYTRYKELMNVPLENNSIFSVIASVCGQNVSDTRRYTIEIARASAEQAQQLGVPLSEPLLHLNCYFIDQNGDPVCIGRQYYIGSRYMLEM